MRRAERWRVRERFEQQKIVQRGRSTPATNASMKQNGVQAASTAGFVHVCQRRSGTGGYEVAIEEEEKERRQR